MFVALLSLLAAGPSPACDDALEHEVARRLPADGGPWLLRCVDAETFELVRAPAQGGPRARVVSLSGISAALRVEVVVLAAEALLREPRRPAPPAAPPAPPNEVSVPSREVGTRLDVLVVPSVEPGAPLRAGFWQAQSGRGFRPLVTGSGRWFPLEGTWLAGGAGGFEFQALQALVRGSAGTAQRSGSTVRALVLEGVVSGALGCLGAQNVAGCLRLEGSLGAASLASSSSGWTVYGQGGVNVELVALLSPVWLGVNLQAAAALGPRAILAGVAGPGWSGLVLGATLQLGWN